MIALVLINLSYMQKLYMCDICKLKRKGWKYDEIKTRYTYIYNY